MLDQTKEKTYLTVNDSNWRNLGRVLVSPYAKNTYKTSLLFYVIVVLLVWVSCSMNSSKKSFSDMAPFLVLGPVFFYILSVIGFYFKIKNASKYSILLSHGQVFHLLKNDAITRMNSSWGEVVFIYKDGAFIEVTKKDNPFRSFPIFGDQEYLEKILNEAKGQGIEIRRLIR